MLRHTMTLLVPILLAAGCQAVEDAMAPGDVEGPFVWGAIPNVTRLGNLWFAGQPDAARFEAAKGKRPGSVIRVAPPGRPT